ncbi:RHO1 GDP-GTP exchange protein 2, variant 2 [Basidiobolus ranarum]|uniref:RHO1 GDP-GTP exchange protein 2, variant 2 n=1 Tax=Basidiobolus ranarum TaxID=34480 RepID=A0ABR2WYZ6_9FUNG
MPYTSPPIPPKSSELLEELSGSTQCWSLKEKEADKENLPRNTRFYSDSAISVPHYNSPYQSNNHMTTPQHEYYRTTIPAQYSTKVNPIHTLPYQSTFPNERVQQNYNRLSSYCTPYYSQVPRTISSYSDSDLVHEKSTSMLLEDKQESYIQPSTPEPYSNHSLRMPHPSDYLSDGPVSKLDSVINPYHTPEFMAFPDPQDYKNSCIKIDPYDPALLPMVRDGLLRSLGNRFKPSQKNEYFDCFSGHELVDSICDVIGEVPRGDSLLIGRLLQEHGVFHHVGSDNRSLMDNDQEFYRLVSTETREKPGLETRKTTGGSNHVAKSEEDCTDFRGSLKRYSLDSLEQDFAPQTITNEVQSGDTPLYSSAHVSRKPTELIRQSTNEYENLWLASVPHRVVESLTDKERNRQIAIFEIIYTEEEYLRDLKLYDSLFIEPLRASRIFHSEKVDRFVQDVFSNYQDLQQLHTEILSAFRERRGVKPIVEMIGDVMVQFSERFEPYIQFGIGSVNSACILKYERSHSSALESFLEECQKKPEARKLPLESFLSRPNSRIARYPLLLDRVLKYTPEEDVDRQMLVCAIDSIREFLIRLNKEAGRAENQLRLQEISDKIEFKSEDYMDLKLNEPDRQLVREGMLKRSLGQSLRVILLDHVLLFAKEKKSFTTGSITYRVYTRPIPLEFLSLQANPSDTIASEDSTKTAYPFSITNISKWGGTHTVVAGSLAERKQWIDKIQEQQAKHMFNRLRVFELVSISDSHFDLNARARCSTLYFTRDGKRKIAIGTTDGLYAGFEGDPASFSKVLTLERVRQVEVLEKINMVLVLQDKLLLTYSTDILDFPESLVNCHGQKLASQVGHFNVGFCQGKLLVVVMKLKGLKSYFKVLEPVTIHHNSKAKGKLLCQRNGYALKLFKEFYVGAESYSVQFLTKKLYVVCLKGFEIINLEALHLNKSKPLTTNS